jgi:hypothetical protein
MGKVSFVKRKNRGKKLKGKLVFLNKVFYQIKIKALYMKSELKYMVNGVRSLFEGKKETYDNCVQHMWHGDAWASLISSLFYIRQRKFVQNPPQFWHLNWIFT